MLRVQLQMLADAAPDYTDAERAIGAYRARRRRRVVVSAAAVVAIVASLVYFLPHSSPITQEPPWIVPAGPIDPRYPPELRLGTTSVPALPDGPVGPALLAAHTSAPDQCAPACPDAVLFTVAGARYALPEVIDGSLSPDGRWLLSAYTLRDLTAAGPPRPLDIDASSSARWQPVTWSPDSRWLLLWRLRNGTLNDYQRIEVATGQVVAGTLPAGEQLLAILSSGDLLTGPIVVENGDRHDPTVLRVLDPDGPRERARVSLTSGAIAGDRTLANGGPEPALVLPDGHSVVLTLNSIGNQTILITVDLRTGHVVRLQPLPDGWRPVAASSRGIVVITTPQRDQGPLDTVIGVIEPSNATGEPSVITRVIRGGTVMLRGANTFA